MNYEPLADNVILEELERLTELYKCRVVKVGPGLPAIIGKPYPMSVKVGDIVLVNRSHVIRLFIEGSGDFFLIREFKIRLKVTS